MKKILLISMILLIKLCFAINNEPMSDVTNWTYMLNGSGFYQITQQGGYTSGIVYYRFVLDGMQPLTIHLQGDSNTVTITMPILKNIFNSAFTALNQRALAAGVHLTFIETTDPTIRAVTITIVPRSGAIGSGDFAFTLIPRLPASYYVLNTIDQVLYNQYGADGGIVLFRYELENNFANMANFLYLRDTVHVFSSNALASDYVRAMFQSLGYHEALHVPGAAHANNGANIYADQQQAGRGHELYMSNTMQPNVNFMPSIMLSVWRTPQYGVNLNIDEYYLYLLSGFLAGPTQTFVPISYQNVDYARQDYNIFYCLGAIAGSSAVPNVLCPVGSTVSVNFHNGIAYLVSLIIVSGVPVLYPIYGSN